jgi:hypothetical protein
MKPRCEWRCPHWPSAFKPSFEVLPLETMHFMSG